MAKTNGKKGGTAKTSEILIAAPRFRVARFTIVGESPYVQNKFSTRQKALIHETQEQGSKAKKGKKRDPKNFTKCFEEAQYKSTQKWGGIPAPAFRNAMISACKICGFAMTRGKLSVFVEADGFDAMDGTPLVKITKGTPIYHESAVRNESGVIDLRARPMWREGWEAVINVRYDADQFSPDDVANLLMRAGQQVGIGEGRPDSKKSCGMGWGLFALKGKQ